MHEKKSKGTVPRTQDGNMPRAPIAYALLLALLMPFLLGGQAAQGHREHLRIQLLDRMQFSASPHRLPLEYSLYIQAQGPLTVIPHLIVDLQEFGGWRLIRSTIFADCRGREWVKPMYLNRDHGAWDLGRRKLPTVGVDGCGTGFVLIPRFQLTPTSARRHRFLVRLYSRLSGRSIDRQSQLATLRWTGEYIDGPS